MMTMSRTTQKHSSITDDRNIPMRKCDHLRRRRWEYRSGLVGCTQSVLHETTVYTHLTSDTGLRPPDETVTQTVLWHLIVSQIEKSKTCSPFCFLSVVNLAIAEEEIKPHYCFFLFTCPHADWFQVPVAQDLIRHAHWWRTFPCLFPLCLIGPIDCTKQ